MNTLKNILMSDDPATTLRNMVDEGTLRDLEPSLADLRMPMVKGYHHKDNLIHSIKVLQNAVEAEKNGPDLILRTAALFHDIGKPATRKFNGRKSVTFDGHEIVGARMVKKILAKHNYSKSEINDVSKIVALHMRSHGFGTGDWTDTAVRRLMNDVGNSNILEQLLIVFHADATTSYPEKLKRHREGIVKLRAEIERVEKEDARKKLRPALNGFDVMTMFNLSQGPQLGKIMKFLNSDEGVYLSKDEAISEIKQRFFDED